MKSKLVFCTLFDHNYLARGLALYRSLEKNHPDFELWVVAMSDIAYNLLVDLNLKKMVVVRLNEFEDEELLKIKNTRSTVEYFWTLTPSIPLYVLKNNKDLDCITYIDADCYFFSDPEPIYKEMGNDSVLIIEHRYSKERKEWEKTSGRFNVEMLIFKNNEIGRSVLNKWRKQCNEWCYYREEEGKFGDQMYLNSWPDDFKGIHILKHLGGGLAPWNIKNYKLSTYNSNVYVNSDKLIFYHYHAFKYSKSGIVDCSSGYAFTAKEIRLIYRPYMEEIKKSYCFISNVVDNYDYGFTEVKGFVSRLRLLVKNVYGLRCNN